MSEQATASESAVRTRVAVCAITFRRREGLEQLLNGFAQLKFKHTQPEIKVVIVENEEDGPGREVVERMRPTFPYPLVFDVEPQRGIPFARNTAMRNAGDVDFIAFIDDDEVPSPQWLDELLHTQAEHDVDLVSGPSLPVFEAPPPEWVVRGGFHYKQRYPTGTHVMPTGTNNVLMRKAMLDAHHFTFDERRALTGCDDGHLFKRMELAGCSSVWSDEAVANETIPLTRCTSQWIAKRSFRIGISHGRRTRELTPSFVPMTRFILRACFQIFRGVVFLPFRAFLGWHGIMTSVKYITRGVGSFCGLFGFRYEEYRTIHGK